MTIVSVVGPSHKYNEENDMEEVGSTSPDIEHLSGMFGACQEFCKQVNISLGLIIAIADQEANGNQVLRDRIIAGKCALRQMLEKQGERVYTPLLTAINPDL